MVIRSIVAGVGAYLPERVMTNAELAGLVDTSDEWIVQRTGIRERHIAAEGELTSDLALRASEAALAQASMSPRDVDLVVLATATPDETFPATATRVQCSVMPPTTLGVLWVCQTGLPGSTRSGLNARKKSVPTLSPVLSSAGCRISRVVPG